MAPSSLRSPFDGGHIERPLNGDLVPHSTVAACPRDRGHLLFFLNHAFNKFPTLFFFLRAPPYNPSTVASIIITIINQDPQQKTGRRRRRGNRGHATGHLILISLNPRRSSYFRDHSPWSSSLGGASSSSSFSLVSCFTMKFQFLLPMDSLVSFSLSSPPYFATCALNSSA